MTKGYHHLTRDQRCQIHTLKERGDTVNTIAKEIKVDKSTIYRELKRNGGKEGYNYKQAHEKAQQRRFIASSRKLKMTNENVRIIDKKINMQWSPEQISGRLKKEKHKSCVSHETIYKHIWDNKRRGGLLYKSLRHRDKKYNKRSKNLAGRGCIPGRIDIEKKVKHCGQKGQTWRSGA